MHNHALVPSNIKLNIVYEDNDLVIVDKPKGLVVHPGAGNYDKTLANGLHINTNKIYLIKWKFKTWHRSQN